MRAFNHDALEQDIFSTLLTTLCALQVTRGGQWLLWVHLPAAGGREDETGGGGQNQGSHPRPVAQRWGTHHPQRQKAVFFFVLFLGLVWIVGCVTDYQGENSPQLFAGKTFSKNKWICKIVNIVGQLMTLNTIFVALVKHFDQTTLDTV